MGKLITSQELQTVYSISRSTVDRWRKEGLPFTKVGRGVRFDEDSVHEWIKKNKQEIKDSK
ncbi:helix-turn-helix domain-containing protein [bacterium]|nr:helix-turn-helix domain-containing protein [bacterium]